GPRTRVPRAEIDPFAPAAIMYTSGTTGVPKGVVHSQHNMVVIPGANCSQGLMNPETRRGAVLPLTITNVMILGPVVAFWNMRPFIVGPSAKIEPLVEWLFRERVESISLVPTMVYDLLQLNADVPKWTHLGCGGAPLPHVVRAAFRKRYGYELTTSYGLTEAPTVVAISQDGDAPEGASGQALSYLAVTIRDGDGQVLPNGVVGEICFTAASDGPWANVYTHPLGYWREAEKTAALLRGGVVHTGDHGSIDDDDWLTVADRSSELILRGGSNVYPAEIERVLHMHDDVADCAVIGKPDLRMGMLTVACVQATRPNVDVTALQDELRALCSERLVRYKIPDEWRFLDSFPRNAMGKIVKPKLREQVLGLQ
ncbi:MAG: fatty acid--CoA ligase family protein, partial [Sphingobium sp.]